MNNPNDNLLEVVSAAMDTQAEAYASLSATTKRLSSALIAGELSTIENLTRQGEKELTQMRSLLLEIMTKLTRFAEERAASGNKLDEQVKERFEKSAKALIEIANEFETISTVAGGLALSGTSFTNACVQECGVTPSTYKKPILRYTEAARR